MKTQLTAWLNAAADAWAAWMWPMTWHVTVLVLVIAMLTWLLRGRSARLRYALWLLVPIRLLLPPTLALATGWGWWLLPSADVAEAPATLPPLVARAVNRGEIEAERAELRPTAPEGFAPSDRVATVNASPRSHESLTLEPAPQTAAVAMSPQAWLFCGWLLGVAILAVRWLHGAACAASMVRRAQAVSFANGRRQESDANTNRENGLDVAELLASCQQRTGVKCQVLLGQLSDAGVPMLIGFVRPTIILPTGLGEQLTRQELEAVLVHELQHVARHDAVVHLVQSLLGVIYFFHPLVWLTNRLLDSLREDACDEATIAVLAGQRRDYGSGIVKIAKLMSGPAPGMSLGIVESSGQIKRRLARILDPRLPVGRRLSRWAFALLVPLAAIVLPVAARPRVSASDEPPKPTAATTTAATTTAAPASEAQAGALAEAPTDTLHKTVRVVNESGEPIAGATVAPWVIRTAQGSAGIWRPNGFGESEPPTLTTDADGKATIPFPRFARKDDRILAKELTCRVQHPDYAETSQNAVSVTAEDLEKVATIVLPQGARVEVIALDGGQPLPAERVRALWSGPGGDGTKIDAQGRLELPPLAAGTRLLRVVYIPEQGPMMISDAETLDLTNGERRELSIEVKPAVRVEGKLDAAVPRPVKNGRIVANIIEKTDGDWWDLPWGATATIDEDGTFTLEDLPRGDLQVIALCDGFKADAGTPPAFAKRPFAGAGSPQVFHLRDARNEIVVEMVPTTSCRVRVLGPDGNPVAGAKCQFSPNVQWWDGGSQMYCAPEVSTAEALRNPQPRGELRELRKDRQELFTATTDAEGIAIVENLPAPADERLTVLHDELELPIGDNNWRIRRVRLQPGKQAEVAVTLQKKGTEFIGSNLRAKGEKSPEELARIKAQEATVAKNAALAKQFDTADAAYAALSRQYDEDRAAHAEAMEKAGSDEQRLKLSRSSPRPLDYAPALLLVAEKYPDDPAAIRALVWIARQCVFGEDAGKALKILGSKYSRSQDFAEYVGTTFLYGEPFEPYEEFLRAVLQDNPGRNVQGAACVSLARYLKMAVEQSQRNLLRIALEGERSLRAESLAALNHLKERGLDKVAAESEMLFERVIKDYADVRLTHSQPPEAGVFATKQLFQLRNLAVGKPALELEGTDLSGAPLKLSDYRGRVVVLDFGSHRTCGICRQLYPQMRSLVEQFAEQPFALIAINEHDDLDELKELADKGDTTWRVVWDGDGAEGRICAQWMIDGMPMLYVLDQAGVIRNKGFLQGDDLIGTVQMLLREKAGVKPETKGNNANAASTAPVVQRNDLIAQLRERGAQITDGGPAGGLTVEIKGEQADDGAVTLLARIGDVWDLTLGPGKFTAASFDSIARLTELRRLHLREMKVTAADTEKLARLPQLASLEFQCPLDDDALQPLKDCPALAGLYFWAPNQISGRGVEAIAAISGLTQLQLVSDLAMDEDLKTLAGCQKLSQLLLGGTRFTGEGLRYLADCASLTTLSLSTPNVRAESLRHLKSAASIDNLNLEGCPQLGDEAVAILGEEATLRMLSLGGAKITDAGLAPLNQLVDLKLLRLMNTRVAGHGLASLTGPTKLTNLDIDGEATTNEAFAHLHQFPALRALWIGSGSPTKLTGITDEGLARIGNVPNLSLISFRGSGITDQGLNLLRSLPNLTDVSFYWTPGVSTTHWRPRAN